MRRGVFVLLLAATAYVGVFWIVYAASQVLLETTQRHAARFEERAAALETELREQPSRTPRNQ